MAQGRRVPEVGHRLGGVITGHDAQSVGSAWVAAFGGMGEQSARSGSGGPPRPFSSISAAAAMASIRPRLAAHR